jgi:hypothetical protein
LFTREEYKNKKTRMPDKNDPEAAEAARLLNSRTTTNLTTVLPKEVKWNIDTECLIAVETSWLSHLMTAPRSLREPGNYQPGETYQRLFRDVLTGRGVWPEDSGQDGKKGKSIALWISTVFEAQREALEQQVDRSDIDERTTDKWRNEQLEIEIQKAMDSILDQQRGDQGLRSYVTALVEYPEHHFSRKNKEFALKLLVRRIIQRGHGTSASRRRCNEWWKILREALKLANMESPPSSYPFFDVFPRYILYGILTASQLAAVQVICPNYLATLLVSHSSLAFQKALLFVSLGLGLTTLDHLLAMNTTSWRSQRRCKELYNSLQSLPTEEILALNTSRSSDWQLKMDQVRHRWGLGLPWWQYYPNHWLPSTSDPGSTLAAHATSTTFQQEDSESPPAYEAVMATSFSYRPPAYSSKISGLAADGSESDGTGLPRSNQIPRLQDKPDERLLLTESQEIVGAVVLLDSPLSVNSLSKLLALSTEQLLQRVSSLHSVLSIPSDPTEPVQLCHLSLRNYLLDPRIRHETPYWVDEKQMHRKLAARCLSICDSLTRNICGLCDNTKRAQIDQWKIDHCFPPEVQYACRYWAHHLVQSYDHISDAPDILLFLKKHLLHWVEAMGILGFAFEVVRIIGLLQSVLHVSIYQMFILLKLICSG